MDRDKWHDDEDGYWRGSKESIPSDCPDIQAAKDLCQRMSDISEDYYAAGWLMGLEYALFEAAFEGDTFGGEKLQHDELHALLDLSHRCDGWWRWHDSDVVAESGERFVRMSDWTEIYKAHQIRTTRLP